MLRRQTARRLQNLQTLQRVQWYNKGNMDSDLETTGLAEGTGSRNTGEPTDKAEGTMALKSNRNEIRGPWEDVGLPR